MSSAFFALLGIMGRFDSQYTYCDRATTPCTQITAPVWYGVAPQGAHFIAGTGLTRTITSILGAGISGISILVSSKALEKEVEYCKDEENVKALLASKSLLLEEEELQKAAIASEMRVKDFNRELIDGYAYLHLEKNPYLVEELTKPLPSLSSQNSPDKIDDDATVSSGTGMKNDEPEPEKTKIPEAIQMMIDSDLREIVDAGILSLVGSQGSGKTTTSCMMLRYRIFKDHKLIIVNPHKRKNMYKGIELYLLPETTFYGVGTGDCGRATSLLSGLEKVLDLLEERYDQYQNLDESEYDHFPVTILLEECAEYDGLLSVFNRPADPKAEDPGFNAKKWLTSFWKKIFVATRKGNSYLIRTLQAESNTMNGTEGLATLIKSQGACTLTQFSVPDGRCIGGWRSTGNGEMKIPNQKYTTEDGNTTDSKSVMVPTYWDYAKVLKDITDFSDLGNSDTATASFNAIPIVEAVEETPEHLFQRAIARLEIDFARDSNEENRNLPLQRKEIAEIDSVPVTPERAIPVEETCATYTPDSLSREQVVTKIQYHQHQGVSQTRIIEILWRVKKNRSGWKSAYKEFKELV